MSSGRLIEEPRTQKVIWDNLRAAFNFQNLSEEDLAYIYENTLVNKQTRKEEALLIS
jgi:hypothetical protein